MYKVFINERPLILADLHAREFPGIGGHNLRPWAPDQLSEAVDFLHNDAESDGALIRSAALNDVWSELKLGYRYIRAAGGLVQNGEGDWLFIHREGKWDLPKGKLEKGEKKRKCAVREVREECGLKKLSIEYKLGNTYHVFPGRRGFVLKRTTWYLMTAPHVPVLKPQIEEGIQEARWVNEGSLDMQWNDTFNNIRDVLTFAGLSRI